MQKSRLHTLSSGADLNPPLLFTNPFSYVPHPLCLEAARELRMLIEENKEWEEELRKGKMFGVMVVRENGRNENNGNNGNNGTNGTNGENGYDEAKELFYLAAFSGQLNGESEVEGFVPPIFDVGQSTYFQQEMHEIELLVGDKEERRRRSEALQDWLFRQYKCRNARGEEKDLIEIFTDFYRGKMLKQENFARNAASHHIPSGSGECCAPKLLQYAYLHGLAPLCMAEFWVQKSFEDKKTRKEEDETNVDFEDEKTRRREDKTYVDFEDEKTGKREDEVAPRQYKEQRFRELNSSEIRHDGRFYPACHKKCRPILSFMLEGLPVEESQMEHQDSKLLDDVRIVYEDAHILVIDKPSGLLSVPGRGTLKSVADWLRSRHPLPDFWFVHRLDQDTRGLLVIAKDEGTYKNLQQQFIRHEVQKTYEALVDGVVVGDEGKIKLRMRPDPDDPPRQIVDMNHGKQAVTRWKVVERLGGQTRVELYPDTGRTHQLRVHCAHPAGLNAPIHGDRLYGVSENPDSNLCLCAKRIKLKVEGEKKTFETKLDKKE